MSIFCPQDQYLLRVVVTELPCKKRSATNTNADEKKDTKTYAEYLEALRDLQTAWISKLGKTNGKKKLMCFLVVKSCVQYP